MLLGAGGASVPRLRSSRARRLTPASRRLARCCAQRSPDPSEDKRPFYAAPLTVAFFSLAASFGFAELKDADLLSPAQFESVSSGLLQAAILAVGAAAAVRHKLFFRP